MTKEKKHYDEDFKRHIVELYNAGRTQAICPVQTPVESRQSCEIGVTEEKVTNKKYQKFWKKVTVHGQKIYIDKSRRLEETSDI